MVVNMLTIDVEEHFHASVFQHAISRAQWDGLESRVCANTDRLLAILDGAGVRGTFFVLGWVAERYPTLVRRIAACGHEIASHGYAHGLIYDDTPDAFPRICANRSAPSKRPRACRSSAIARRVIQLRAGRSGPSTS
jgi:peptidoglycan/xylan/chitin deacetylase (PgdA/CDA1 family)